MKTKILLWPLLPALLFACQSASPPATFLMTLNPPNPTLTVNQGSSGSLAAIFTPQNGFSATVSLDLVRQDGTAAPAGLSLSPITVPVSTNPTNATLSLSVGASTPTGTHALRVRAVSGSIQREANFSLEVPVPGLQLSLGQGLWSLTRGEAVTYSLTPLTLTPQGGFNDTVNLVLEQQNGTPAPASLTLSPNTVPVSGSAPITVNLTLASSTDTPTGPHALRVRAAGGGLSTICGSHCVGFNLYVGARGELDPTFGSGGKVLTPVGTGNDYANALVLQPDGKLVAAGWGDDGGTGVFALARYLPNGSLDTSFGSGGKVVTPVGTGSSGANALVLQPDGKLVAAGWSVSGDNDFALVRYNPDGSLDTTFGSGGKVITPVGTGNDYANALVLQPDGKLVAAGHSWNSSTRRFNFGLVRYNPDGSLDTTFGSGGMVATPVGTDDNIAKTLVLQPDGKLVAAGWSDDGISNSYSTLVRYNPDGSLDTNFGTSGKLITSLGPSSSAYALVLQPDGKILVAGYSFSGTNGDFALVRHHPDGSLDTSFGNGGKVVTDINTGSDFAAALILQPDGKLVAAGNSYDVAGRTYFALVRYYPDGSLDTSFGNGGKVVTGVGSIEDEAHALVLQPDGKLVAAGESEGSSNTVFVLVRYY